MSEDIHYTYLDWAATTPLCAEAKEAMEPYLVVGEQGLVKGANANSLHSYGRNAFLALEEARKLLAKSLGLKREDELIFTSSATESNNSALFGIVSACKKQATQAGKRDFVPHIITTEIEHDSVLAAARALGAKACELSFLKPDRQGFIEARLLAAALRENTVLVSIQSANNEIGSIQPLEQLVAIAHDAGAYFHTDAVQAFGKVNLNLKELGVDAASISAHKIGGPKGIGALYLKNTTPFTPYMLGGGQETNRRSGTQNVCGAAAFAAAASASLASLDTEQLRLRKLRDYLYERCLGIEAVSPVVSVEPGSQDFLPHIVNLSVQGFESETLILRLDMRGFAVSGGSACSTNSLEPSHVLSAIGLSRDAAYGSVRISMGKSTQEKDIDAFIEALAESIY